MAALTDRQKARERLSQVFQSILDKMIPADEAVPLAGSKFVEWEDLGDEVDRTLVPVFLEERAALAALPIGSGLPDQAGWTGRGDDTARPGCFEKAEVSMPILRPVFFPLK